MIRTPFINWCAQDSIDGTAILLPLEELAYRRILDLIYVTSDNLPDDDRRIGWLTKMGRQWHKIKQALVDLGKIEIVEGRITNTRCRAELDAAANRINRGSVAGKASGKSRGAQACQHQLHTPEANQDANSDPTQDVETQLGANLESTRTPPLTRAEESFYESVAEETTLILPANSALMAKTGSAEPVASLPDSPALAAAADPVAELGGSELTPLPFKDWLGSFGEWITSLQSAPLDRLEASFPPLDSPALVAAADPAAEEESFYKLDEEETTPTLPAEPNNSMPAPAAEPNLETKPPACAKSQKANAGIQNPEPLPPDVQRWVNDIAAKFNRAEQIQAECLLQTGFPSFDSPALAAAADPAAEEDDSELIPLPSNLPSAPVAKDIVAEAFARYNRMAKQEDLSVAQKLSGARRRKIQDRLRDCGGLDGWDAALEKIAASDFCKGVSSTGWQADLDFLLQESSFIKLMEGKYDNRAPRVATGNDQDELLTAYLSGQKLGPADELVAAGLSILADYQRADIDTSAPNTSRL